jgi:hypothetical protein
MGRTHILGFLSSEVVWPLLKKMNAWDICWWVNELFPPPKKEELLSVKLPTCLGISLALVLLKDNLNKMWTATKRMPMWGTRRIIRTCARIFTKVSKRPRNHFKDNHNCWDAGLWVQLRNQWYNCDWSKTTEWTNQVSNSALNEIYKQCHWDYCVKSQRDHCQVNNIVWKAYIIVTDNQIQSRSDLIAQYYPCFYFLCLLHFQVFDTEIICLDL